MNAGGVWAGLADSVFLAGASDRERDPTRLTVTILGGSALGLVAAICSMLLILVVYAILTGYGPRGIEGLSDAARTLGDSDANTVFAAVLRLIVATAVDGLFLIVFVAFAAVVAAQPLHVYVTAAIQIRWRLLLVSMALAVAAMAPIVVVERLLTTSATLPPSIAGSTGVGDRIAYVAASLLLIPAAAAEELFFRGWLLRQAGVYLRRPLALVGGTALVFSALHMDFAPDAFLTRAVMGAGFAYMTLRLGGIEFSTGVHSVNNILIVLFLQPLTLDQAPATNITAFSLAEDIALVGGYVLITELTARLPALRRLAGVRVEEVSGSGDISAHFG